MNAYRKSWFDEIGVTKFPETWEQYHDAGKKLKAKGSQIGQSAIRSGTPRRLFIRCCGRSAARRWQKTGRRS